jgi:transcription elongation factor GreA
MTDDTPISHQGRADLEAELERLKTVERRRIADEIRVARDFGDLKENAEYHEAKRAQGHLETRIARLDAHLRSAVVHDAPDHADVVSFGSRVRVRDEAHGRETESNVGSGALSSSSPVARALLGAREAETVSVEAPSGARRLTVLRIS